MAALTSDTATTIWLVLLCAGGAWMALTLWRAPSVSGVPVLEFSVVLIAMLLAAPHAQRQYFSALIVPVLVALGMVVQKSAASRGLPVALAATVATGTVLPLILGSRRLAVMYEASSPYFFGALLLFGVLLTVTARLKAPLKIGADAPLRAVNAATMWGAAAAVFALVFVFRLLHVQFTDDHFDRISRGRQILAAGDVPFRDFFDPGFLLTSYSSAAMQRLFGYNLLGEALLTICFIAAGFAIAVVLGWKISRSWPAAVIATAIGAAMLPRLYNYDKVLFLPLGALACWSYAARPSHRRLMAIAGIIVLAAMYRADNGLYLAAGAIAAIVSVQWGAWRSMLRHASTLGAFVLVFSIPVLAFLQSTAGVPEAARQVLEYAQREGRRTDIFSAPRLAVDRHAPWRTLGAPVNVRWQADVDQARRGALEQAFHLERGDFAGGRTWRYWLTDASATNVKTLVGDPAVEDTHGLLTTAGTYEAVPTVSVLPGVLTEANAAAWLYYALLALAILGTTAGCRSADRTTRAALVSCGALLLTAHLFLLRSPLEARVGDVAAAAVPLAAWALTSSWQQRGKGLMAGVTILCTAGLIVTTLAVSVLAGPMLRAPIDREGLARLAASPPPIALMPAGRAAGVVEYLRECTSPEDRVLVTWFAPDLHFFSGRAFAGGMNVIFGGHWSSEADQQAILARLQSQPVPVAVVELDTYPEFRTDFPGIDRYLQSEYSTVADHTFGSTEGTYRLFIRNGTPISGVDSRWGLPCAVGSRQ